MSSNFEDLFIPDDVWLVILEKLPFRERFRLERVGRLFRRLSQVLEQIKRNFYEERYPEPAGLGALIVSRGCGGWGALLHSPRVHVSIRCSLFQLRPVGEGGRAQLQEKYHVAVQFHPEAASPAALARLTLRQLSIDRARQPESSYAGAYSFKHATHTWTVATHPDRPMAYHPRQRALDWASLVLETDVLYFSDSK